MTFMESSKSICAVWAIAATLILAGCQPSAPPAAPPTPQADPAAESIETPDPSTTWAQVLRSADDAGLTHNDKRTVDSIQNIDKLKSFFPDMKTATESTMHAAWQPLIVVHFHAANGPDTFVLSDYRIYRVDDGRRGDFVIGPGFTDYVDRLFSQPQ